MLVVNIAEAKAKLSEYIDLAAGGERVLISKRNRPVAELRPVEAARTEPRPIGLGRGVFDVPDAFFEPLPGEVLEAFEGGRAGGTARPTRAAEARERYESGRARRARGRRKT